MLLKEQLKFITKAEKDLIDERHRVGIQAREQERQRKRQVKAWPKNEAIPTELMEPIRDPDHTPTLIETEALRATPSFYEALQELDPENILLVGPQGQAESSGNDNIDIRTQKEAELPIMPPECLRDLTPPNFYELQEALSSELDFELSHDYISFN
jgi:hypothetical protein